MVGKFDINKMQKKIEFWRKKNSEVVFTMGHCIDRSGCDLLKLVFYHFS